MPDCIQDGRGRKVRRPATSLVSRWCKRKVPEPSTGKTSSYIHGTAPQEQARLSLLNDLLNARCLRELDLKGGERILDVGSGLGQLSRAMGDVARVRVVAVDRSAG